MPRVGAARRGRRYLLSDYLRLRHHKLRKYPLHYMDPQNQSLLSSSERIWLREFWDSKRMYFENRFLSCLQKEKRHLNQQQCYTAPSSLGRIHGELGQITPSDTRSSQGTTEPLRLEEGQTYLIRYAIVRQFLLDAEHDGKVQLV
eukprot:g26279.t3